MLIQNIAESYILYLKEYSLWVSHFSSKLFLNTSLSHIHQPRKLPKGYVGVETQWLERSLLQIHWPMAGGWLSYELAGQKGNSQFILKLSLAQLHNARMLLCLGSLFAQSAFFVNWYFVHCFCSYIVLTFIFFYHLQVSITKYGAIVLQQGL